MKARDIMTGPPLTALPETPVGEIARLLTEHRISGVPIVNEQGELVGMVTESDLFLKEKGVPFSLVRVPALFNQWADPKRIIEVYEHARRYTAADVMTRNVFSVGVEEQIGEVARLMLRHKVKRLPVLENGRLVGIITRQDLIVFLAEPAQARGCTAE
jgi:CBS domain-containing protein